MKICTVPPCQKPARSPKASYCETHYARLRRNGHLGLSARKRRDQAGYKLCMPPEGHPLWNRGRMVREHRLILFGKIGAGEHLCHWCSRVVAWERTYPQDADGLCVDHLDGDKSNNDPSNLVPCCNRCNLGRVPPHNFKRPSRSELHERLSQRGTMTAVAREMKCSVSSVANWCDYYGIPKPPAGRPRSSLAGLEQRA